MMTNAWLNLSGLWVVDPQWLQTHLTLFSSLTAQPVDLEAASRNESFERAGDVAIIPISGPITRHMSFWSYFFGGTSTEGVKASIRDALGDETVSAIMLAVDSPGGTVSGVNGLGEVIRRARDIKPIVAHIDDLGASAAYWLASQASTVTADPTAEIGSIGTMAVIDDLSEMAAMEGVKVHVITSKGAEDHKGMGVPGTEVTDTHLEEIQKRVDQLNEFFIAAIARGRGITKAQARTLADGRVHIAAHAKELGLVDNVLPFDEALSALQKRVRTRRQRAMLIEDFNHRREAREHRSIA